MAEEKNCGGFAHTSTHVSSENAEDIYYLIVEALAGEHARACPLRACCSSPCFSQPCCGALTLSVARLLVLASWFILSKQCSQQAVQASREALAWERA